MELPNSKSIENYCFNAKYSHLLEAKQTSVIKLLKEEYEKLMQNLKQESTSIHKLQGRKQILRKYTMKLEVPRSSAEHLNEAFRHGWRVKRASNLSERSKEMERRRKEMISLGNMFSISNKVPSHTSIASKQLGRNVSTDELRREMLLKGRELGNFYSKTFKRNSSTSLITVDELDRYHRLKTKKREFENNYRKNLKSGDNNADKPRREYLNLIDDTTHLEKMLSFKNRRARGELYKLLR